MIVTLTANPSIDRAVALSAPLVPGEVQRAASSREDAGGKGVNVARAIAAAGASALAVVPVGDGDPYRELLAEAGVPVRSVPVTGRVRANLTVTDPGGITTKINLAGPRFGADDAQRLLTATVAACAGARWLALAGSLPPGLGDGFYVDVIRAVREAWGQRAPRIAVDTSGPALAAVVEHARPDLIKPNEEELAELLGLDSASDSDPLDAVASRACALVPVRVREVLVTLGSRGAMLVDAEGVLRARTARISVASTVGAGDSALAGYLLADLGGASRAERLSHAVAYGAAAASLPGTQAPSPHDLPEAVIETPPHSPER